MTETTCAVDGCGRPAHNATICVPCTDQLERDLGDVQAYTDELNLTLSRQTAGPARHGGRSAEKPLPFSVAASEALRVLHSTLHGWVRVAVEEDDADWPTDTSPAMAALLMRRLSWLRQHQAADEAVDEVGSAVELARRTVDRPAERIYAGTCGSDIAAAAPWSDADARTSPPEGARLGTCDQPLYGAPGRSTVSCPGCGTEHNVEDRRQQMMDELHDRLFTAGEIAMLSTYLAPPGADVGERQRTRALLNQWAVRGQIVPHGINMQGAPTYRFGDVIEKLMLRRAS